MQKITDLKELRKKAYQLRIDTLKMLDKAGSGHIGGAYGMADFLTVLYYYKMKIDSANPDWQDRDYLLISNGHTCPIWYATLADLGYFEKSELQSLRNIDSLLQGHPKIMIPGVENSSGPLGHGLSQAVGIALGLKMDKRKNLVYCYLSDGEQQEGQTWEAAMAANKWKLDNLVGIMDRNGLQIEGSTDEIMPLGNIKQKYESFGWHVIEMDGHDYEQIMNSLNEVDLIQHKPKMIISNSILGKGVSFMEDNWEFHDYKPVGDERMETAISELSSQL